MLVWCIRAAARASRWKRTCADPSPAAAAFADQAVASLRDAINAGWNWPNDLKEPDFDAIRGRDDFKKLVAEVEAKAEKK